MSFRHWTSSFSFAMANLLASVAFANVCGTDYQIFNPTTSGLEFVTVHSSQTLGPCAMNAGLFLNYAANSLAYSQTLNAGFPAGQKRKDRTVGMDLNVGFGLNDHWDIGASIPFILSQSVQDDYYVSAIGDNGATELKINTKYRIWNNSASGIAAVFSINNNLIADNPFSGKNPGPTYNFELAADTKVDSNWAAGINFGYRDRNAGEPIGGLPFLPMGDQWIYSTAINYRLSSLATSVIFEVYGSTAAQKINPETDRNMNSLEGLVGFKREIGTDLTLNFGGTHQLDASLGGAEWRVYLGLNWGVGPVCK